MGILDKFTNFITGDNSGLNIANLIGNIGNAYLKDNTSSDYMAALKAQADQNYANYSSNYDATKAYNEALAAYQAKAAAASSANSAASAAAARQNAENRKVASEKTEKNKNKAALKSIDTYKNYYGDAMGLLTPFTDAAKSVVPKAAETYNNALGSLDLLRAYYTSPEKIAAQQPAKNSWDTILPFLKF